MSKFLDVVEIEFLSIRCCFLCMFLLCVVFVWFAYITNMHVMMVAFLFVHDMRIRHYHLVAIDYMFRTFCCAMFMNV